MTVRWTEAAIQHLIAIYQYLNQGSQFYSQRVVDTLLGQSERLVELTRSGRIVSEFGTQEIS